MASSTIHHHHFICHFCFNEFRDHPSLLAHFPQCHIKTSPKRNDETTRLPRLNKQDRDMLHMLKLHRLTDKFIPPKPKDKTNSYFQISLSIGSKPSSSHSSSFDDNESEQEIFSNALNKSFSTSCHLYKYSRREQKNFYASVKRARLKKQYIPSKRTRTNPLIFNKKNAYISLPTKITSRQRINTNSNNSYPLLFDPNFNTLVQISANNFFENYSHDIKNHFRLIHSIASQEFQIIVNSNDNQHQLSYTAFSFINILRQTMAEYSATLQKTFKRNYFQAFHHHDQPIMTPPKIPRYDQSTSTSSFIQIDDHVENQLQNHIPATTIQIDNNHSVIHPVPSDLILIDHRQSTNQPIINSFIPIPEVQNSTRKSPSPMIILSEPKTEPIEHDEVILPLDRTLIHLLNGSNHKKSSSSRKKSLNIKKKSDENSLVKPIRMSTRHNAIKTELTPEMYPTFETKPVILSASEITKQWSKHNVFYRCHACSYEEFFVVLSRECMNLHISSQHGNMEENFKQRLSNYLTPKGRSLKVFQHFLKWQQPWSEKQIEQIFKLSNK